MTMAHGHKTRATSTSTRAGGTRQPDRRVERTQRVLREALIRLVFERGWENVRVQDVCERAGVGRSTFYVHFADKEELLVHGFGDLRAALRAHMVAVPGEPLAFTTALFEHAREYAPLFKALVGGRTAVTVQQAFLELVRGLVAEDLSREGASASPMRDAAVAYVAGAFWELLRWWLEQRRPSSAAEVAVTFRRLTTPVLREIRP
jgi:AcrR family transcriptional regulator